MGLFTWLNKVYNNTTKFQIYNPDSALINIDKCLCCNQNKTFNFSEIATQKIDNDFLEHDGYFTKLVDTDKNIIGYIFRCTHKNVEAVGVNHETNEQTKIVFPYVVTCYYQPVIPNISYKTIKTLGKACALKSGVRSLKFYLKATNDLTLETYNPIKSEYLDTLFPSYETIKTNQELYPELYNISEESYKDFKDYIKVFDQKTFKYYNGIEKEKIVKIWLKSEN